MLGPSLDKWSRSALSKGPSRLVVSLPSPKDGNRSSFRNVVFSSYLEFQAMNRVLCFTYKPSSQTFRFYSSEDYTGAREHSDKRRTVLSSGMTLLHAPLSANSGNDAAKF
jgi:hypothetical protein